MRLLAAACLGGLLAAATPAAAARTTVHVTGRVIDGSGKPVRGALVSFELRPDRTLYDQADCPVRPWEIQCKVHKVAARTDAAGKYRLPVRLSSFLATMRRHHVLVTDAARPGVKQPAQTEVTLYFQKQPVALPDLPVWRAKASVDAAADGTRTLRVDQLTPVYGTRYSTGPVVTLRQGAETVWTFREVTADRAVDPRLVESGTNAIRASDVAIRNRFAVTYWSPVYAVRGGVKPLSRGVPCSTYGRNDVPVPLAGCRFTDGRLATPVEPQYQRAGNKACEVPAQCAHPRRFVFDLGALRQVGAVLVRGCVPGAVEVSPDGAVAWAPYPTHDFGDGLPVGAPLPARYVRVDLSKCVYKATEVSVFAPPVG